MFTPSWTWAPRLTSRLYSTSTSPSREGPQNVVLSLVRRILQHAVPVWASFYAVHQQKIESIQRRLVRFAARVLPWNDPVTLAPYSNLYALVSLPTLQHRRNLVQRLFVLRNHNDCSDLLEDVHVRVPQRELRNHQLLAVPRHGELRTPQSY
uniref:(northern house mosquito) hypothetical protein n=1 Tax=Culex pipiens TaxID=7175 RepID=A0A8D8D1P6_CULPI